MTATEDLRRMLDERGVEWWPMHDVENGYHQDRDTEFVIDGKKYTAHEWGGRLTVYGLTPAQAVEATLGREVTGETSDGYHTFNELYHHRAVLFSVIVRDHRELAWKSKAHHDGTMYDGMFIVGIETPEGQATYHYDIDPYWDMFDCKELDRAPEWDGHTPDEAIEHAKEAARTCEDSACVAVYMQLAEWLRQARGADAAARWYTKKIRELEDERERMFRANVEKNNEVLRLLAENAKLKEELEAVGTAAYLYGRSDLKIENAKLREERDYHKALWEHATVTDCELRRVRAAWKKDREQNAKLRELVDGLTWCCKHYSCRQECPLYDVSEPDHCRKASIKRELGIEVEA